MVSLRVDIKKKDLWLLSAIVVFLIGVGLIIGFGDYSGDEAQVNGHSSDEIMVNDTSGSLVTLQSLIDDGWIGGVSSPACTFCKTCGGEWTSYQGTFVDYENIARYRGDNCAGEPNQQWVSTNNPQFCCK